jgi:hypothetical protein
VPSTRARFDVETLMLVGQVCDQAWRDLNQTMFFPDPKAADDVRRTIATRVLAAVTNGERDMERLKAMVIESIEV